MTRHNGQRQICTPSTVGNDADNPDKDFLLEGPTLSSAMGFAEIQKNEFSGTAMSKMTDMWNRSDDFTKDIFHRNSQVRITELGKKGRGLTAWEDFQKGEFILEYVGVWKWRQECPLPKHASYINEVGGGLYMDATNRGNVTRYVNHRCQDGNTVLERKWFGKRLHLYLKTCKPISKGEEITYDYNFGVPQSGLNIPCLCGSAKCKGVIKERYIKKAAPKKAKLVCGLCSPLREWKTWQKLKDHVNTHTRETVFNCNYCDKTFTHQANVSRHRRVKHKGKEKMFNCKIPGCDRIFTRNDNLTRHVKTCRGSNK